MTMKTTPSSAMNMVNIAAVYVKTRNKSRSAQFTLTTTVIHVTTIISIILAIIGGTEAVIENSNGNNLEYKEYWYKTEQLCPDLQEAVMGKDIDTANYPYKSVFRFMDHLQSVSEPYSDLPCILEANGPKKLVSTALIEAIHVDNRPWNYTNAGTCEEHIKLRLPEPTFLKRSNVPKIICRIPKFRNGLKDVTGSLYHPYIWQFQKNKLGLSFSSLNLTHLVQPQMSSLGKVNSTDSEDFQNETNSSTARNNEQNYWLERDREGRQFVQIVFTTRFGGTCNIRVQQYLVDPQKTLCGDMQMRSPFRLCGLYDCSKKESILRTLGFWTHQKAHDQLDILLQSNLPRWRREEPFEGYLEILVSTLRALIMPLLFLSVFYITRRLRLKLSNRHGAGRGRSHGEGGDRHRSVLRQRQCYLRSLMREGEGSNNNSSGSSDSGGSAEHMLRPSLILNHVIYDIPVGGREYSVYEDLPPPYESIVQPLQPPSYNVATQVKQSLSPCPMVLEGGTSPNLVASPLVTAEIGEEHRGVVSTNAPTNEESSTMPRNNSASQENTGSRISILNEEVVFQTPPETRPGAMDGNRPTVSLERTAESTTSLHQPA